MKTKARRDELRKLINDLLYSIAQTNTASTSTKNVSDVFEVEDKKDGSKVLDYVSRRMVSSEGSLIILSSQEELWGEVITKLRQFKSNSVSAQYVDKKLSHLIWECKSKNWQLSQMEQEIASLLDSIYTAEVATRKVLLPIGGLVTRTLSFIIGDVEFKPRAQCPILDEDLRCLEEGQKIPALQKIQTIALTEATGVDDNMILENAENKVNRALNILRAFRYPFVANSALKQLGIMSVCYPMQKLYTIEANQSDEEDLSQGVSSGWSVSDIVNIVISDPIAKVHFTNIGLYTVGSWLVSASSDLERSLLQAAELLGEATKPDTLESKFLKIALAIDAMVGDEPTELIPDKGLRARVAERAAFILADKYEDRRIVFDEIGKFFQKRGKLAHGALAPLSQEEIERFGIYARTILTSLLKLLQHQPFKDINDLAEWALRKSLGEII
jgi:hypothetical protein